MSQPLASPQLSSSPKTSRQTSVGRSNVCQTIDVKHLRRTDESAPSLGKPAWLQEILNDWENPVFKPAQKVIRSVQAQGRPRLEHFHSENVVDAPQYRLDKEMLQWCNFVAQIDCKFLLFAHRGEHESTLILVDQHAADERIRVEGFLKDFCKKYQHNETEKTPLSPCKTLLLTEREVSSAQHHYYWFSRWGFDISRDVQTGRSSGDFAQMSVKTVPTLLAERLALEDRVLHTVIRAMISHADERGLEKQRNRNLSWTNVVKDMPDALLDLINSKACRGRFCCTEAASCRH